MFHFVGKCEKPSFRGGRASKISSAPMPAGREAAQAEHLWRRRQLHRPPERSVRGSCSQSQLLLLLLLLFLLLLVLLDYDYNFLFL